MIGSYNLCPCTIIKFICRIKDLEEEQYTQREADIAAGKSIEMLPPAHGGSVRMA